MSKKQQMKNATRRVKTKGSRWGNFWKRVWNIVCWPFRMIWRGCKWFWRWLCAIDLVGLINLTLITAIVVLIYMLVMDVTRCGQDKTPVVDESVAETVVVATPQLDELAKNIKEPTNTLPMKRDEKTNEYINEPINIVPVQPDPVAVSQIAKQENRLMGDVVIDSRGASTVIEHNTLVQGNLYLQNMRKYTLPCGVVIDGNLFLRDVNKLQFCGEFTVKGNIFVSPRSSFGPIPGTARVGGYVIL